MDQDAAFAEIVLYDVVEVVEEGSDVFLLAVQQRVHDV